MQSISKRSKEAGQELTSTPVSGTTDALIPLVYDELRRLAAYRLSHEKPGQLYESAALVDEAYLRLMQHPDVHWENKRHFFVAAAEAMRRILIENARKNRCRKRGGKWRRVEIDLSSLSSHPAPKEIEWVDEALARFEEVDPESAELVKLRFFAGFTEQQAAQILGISKRTADNRWAFARVWLAAAIQAAEN